ncbi:MAG: hypothetical protein ACOYOS_18720 [Syntrophales bacterium]
MGLIIAPGGWVDVHILLVACRGHHFDLTHAELEEVVRQYSAFKKSYVIVDHFRCAQKCDRVCFFNSATNQRKYHHYPAGCRFHRSIYCSCSNLGGLVKSRHTGENRRPVFL